MSGVLNTLAVLAFGFLLLILQSALTNVVHAPAFAPNLMLPIVIFLGVSPDVQLLRGALLS
ncbi:MAG: hypothetical protein OEY14_07580, partial [Myxococcales bacterium]|nr:hypothetical protein [Myxococcales bacterium]